MDYFGAAMTEEYLDLYYYPDDNLFTTADGVPVLGDIYEVITPNDLYLFRECLENTFTHRSYPNITIKIERPDEDWEDSYYNDIT